MLATLLLLLPAQDALKVDLIAKAQKGSSQPQLIVHALKKLERVSIDLKRSDGKRVQKTEGPIYPGRPQKFELPVAKIGPARFEGTLAVKAKGGSEGSMPLDLAVELLPALKLRTESVDLAAGRIAVDANRPLTKVAVALMSDTGHDLGTTEADGGVVQYARPKETIMKIAVQGWDEHGFFGGIDLYPWRVDIPHEEVSFASGKSGIEKSEVPKLEKSFGLITAAIRKYGKLATIKLFVAGHTDTVSDAAYNRELSRDRARAIGRWFKKRGVRIPIRYAGFGEDMLAVETPDNTDEPANRRAEYIVSVDPPQMKGSARWKPLD